FTLQGNYTFGKAIDDTDGETGSTAWQDGWNRRAERGLAGFDVRHRVNLVGLWQLPFYRAGRNLGQRLLGNWELAGVAIIDSGTPLTVTNGAAFRLDPTKTINLGGDYNADGSGGDRPNAPASSFETSGFSRSQFLTGILPASLFTAPSPGTGGNLG